MNKAIQGAIQSKSPFTAVSFKSGQCQAWGVFNMNKHYTNTKNPVNFPKLVQDKKTGQWYNPQEAFDQLMNKPEIMAVLKRLTVR